MEQYYVGFNKRSDKMIADLMKLGAATICKWLPKIEELNKKYGFYEGEWMIVSCSTDESELMNVRNYLFGLCEFDDELEFEIIAKRD